MSKGPRKSKIAGAVGDPSRRDLRLEWAQEGVLIHPADNRVEEGIECVKSNMKPVIGPRKFHIDHKCTDCRREFGSYKINLKTNEIIKKFDDTMDDLRYFLMWKMPKAKQTAVAGGRNVYK